MFMLMCDCGQSSIDPTQVLERIGDLHALSYISFEVLNRMTHRGFEHVWSGFIKGSKVKMASK
jgi:hypothetical protein